ncbi:PaaI family thioesterase [Corynebacterium caspium]|uniref:PaaI family thioesterase n=1 Tax=Corynebacterium caspium TaxID=234828 RepID=UPI0003648789|nr:PaaI family thioesterase [Corynebacterium caspium]WKD59324.1 Putative esterase [Corynebacterium caspium DSM 44850]
MNEQFKAKSNLSKLLAVLAAAQNGPLSAAQLVELNDLLTGLEKLLGLRYTSLDATAPVLAAAELEITPQLLQPAGDLHGGVLAAITESLGSVAGIAAAGGFPVVGLSNNTSFLKRAKSRKIMAMASADHLGRRTQAWNIKFYDGSLSGDLVARGYLQTLVLNKPQPASTE